MVASRVRRADFMAKGMTNFLAMMGLLSIILWFYDIMLNESSGHALLVEKSPAYLDAGRRAGLVARAATMSNID